MNQKKRVNTYIIESNNDANLRVDFNKSCYCVKCGNKITEGRFCDEDCKRNYYEELRQDNDDIYSNVF